MLLEQGNVYRTRLREGTVYVATIVKVLPGFTQAWDVHLTATVKDSRVVVTATASTDFVKDTFSAEVEPWAVDSAVDLLCEYVAAYAPEKHPAEADAGDEDESEEDDDDAF